MKLIVINNSKGSVCKTTLSAHLGAALAIRGKRVIVADGDPQGHATLLLGASKSPAIYDLFVRDAPFSETLQLVRPQLYAANVDQVQGQLWLLAGNKETRNIDKLLEDTLYVRERLNELEDDIDYVIFDTSPTATDVNAVWQTNADAILYPTHCELLSMDGLAESLIDRSRVALTRKQFDLAPAHVLGIVPVMYQKTYLHELNYQKLRERFGDAVWQPHPRRIAWAEAAQDGHLMFAYAPKSAAAKDGWKLADELERRLEAWLSLKV